jgi:hypothetical protein
MFAALMLVAAGLSPAAEPEKPPPLRYWRPSGGGKFELETEVASRRTADGLTVVSTTARDEESMRLTVRYDARGRLTGAEAARQTPQGTRKVTLAVQEGQAQIKRGGVTDLFPVTGDTVVTTDPDTSDVFQLVRRYDAGKGGRQQFAGLWVHPVEPPEALTLTIEHLGTDKVKVEDRTVELDRYRVHRRGGDCLVWADASGIVCKLLPARGGATPVVLEGFEQATRDLKGGARD